MNIIIKNVLFNKYIKALAYKVLSSPIANLSVYQHFYQRKVSQKMARFDTRPISISIENTNICFGGCTFCPHPKMKRGKGVMDMVLFKNLVDQVVSWGIETIAVTGFGEPLLDPQFFDRIKYCKNSGIKCVYANVNSIFITEEIGDKLLHSGIDQIYISCNKRGADNAMRFCAMKKNHTPLIYLSGIKGDFEPQKYPGSDGVSISFAHNWSGDVNRNLNQCRRDPCKMIWQSIYITWDGKAILCCLDYDARCIIGDAAKENLRDIWNSKKLNALKELHKKGEYSSISICDNCTNNYHNKASWWA